MEAACGEHVNVDSFLGKNLPRGFMAQRTCTDKLYNDYLTDV